TVALEQVAGFLGGLTVKQEHGAVFLGIFAVGVAGAAAFKLGPVGHFLQVFNALGNAANVGVVVLQLVRGKTDTAHKVGFDEFAGAGIVHQASGYQGADAGFRLRLGLAAKNAIQFLHGVLPCLQRCQLCLQLFDGVGVVAGNAALAYCCGLVCVVFGLLLQFKGFFIALLNAFPIPAVATFGVMAHKNRLTKGNGLCHVVRLGVCRVCLSFGLCGLGLIPCFPCCLLRFIGVHDLISK